MKKSFYKMHGIGNDYIYFDCFDWMPQDPAALAVKLSDRHFSVGGDGVILVCRSDIADGKMRMFNADGSEGKMCGNGVRCVGRFLYDIKGIKKDVLTVETLSGVKTLKVDQKSADGLSAEAFTVDMGAPVFKPDEIPALFAAEPILSHPLIVGEKTYRVTCLSMGNPHCVVFGEDPDGIELEKIGPLFERHPAFPERVNTEFVQVLGKNELKMRVWERGSGETLACGTGACASAVAAVLNGFAERNAPIYLRLKGGTLRIEVTDSTVLMTGPAEFAFTGEAEVS